MGPSKRKLGEMEGHNGHKGKNDDLFTKSADWPCFARAKKWKDPGEMGREGRDDGFPPHHVFIHGFYERVLFVWSTLYSR